MVHTWRNHSDGYQVFGDSLEPSETLVLVSLSRNELRVRGPLGCERIHRTILLDLGQGHAEGRGLPSGFLVRQLYAPERGTLLKGMSKQARACSAAKENVPPKTKLFQMKFRQDGSCVR